MKWETKVIDEKDTRITLYKQRLFTTLLSLTIVSFGIRI